MRQRESLFDHWIRSLSSPYYRPLERFDRFLEFSFQRSVVVTACERVLWRNGYIAPKQVLPQSRMLKNIVGMRVELPMKQSSLRLVTQEPSNSPFFEGR